MTKPKTPPETEAYDIRDRLHEILDARHINAASLATSVGMNQQQRMTASPIADGLKPPSCCASAAS